MRACLLLFFLATRAFAATELSCNSGKPLALDFHSDSDARASCATATTKAQCSTLVEKLLEASNRLNPLREAACTRMESITQDIADVGAQADAQKKAADIAGEALGVSRPYLDELNRQYNLIKDSLTTQAGPLAVQAAPPGAATVATAATDPGEQEKQLIRQGVASPGKLSQLDALKPAPSISDIQLALGRPDASLFAAVNGANYLKKIKKEQDEVSKRIANLQSIHDDGLKNWKNNGDPSGGDDDKNKNKGDPSKVTEGSGSGLDMKTLAGLATAGAALAPLLQKKDAPNSSDNASTSPTSGSTNDPAAKAPESTKLGDDKAPSSPIAGTNPKKEDPSTPNRVPSGSSFHDNSDVSHSYGALGGGAIGPSTGAAPAHAIAGGGGGTPGGGDSSAEPSAAAAKSPSAPAGDDTQGIGGGSLGGGGPPSLGGASMGPGGDPAAAAAASPEDTMKDLLHEMKETAEGANSPNLQASNADIPMTDEDLFPRVRNAYVRALKQGRILDSLAEKITEENQ